MQSTLKKQRAYFQSDMTKSYAFRIKQLKKLKQAIIKYESQITEALYQDLHKSSFEAYSTEIGFTLMSIRMAERKLKRWMKVKRVKTPFYQLFTKSYIMKEPLGNILIIGPYNYPFQLVIEPLIGAISSGNTAIIKPSEYTEETEKILTKMISETFDSEYISIFTGDYQVTSELLKLKFDHIFFTGSTTVGHIVYEAASKHLTPVTLELGGKSPTIVDETAKIEIAARRIAFGKFINAGQTCIAPDYIYVHESVHDQLVDALKKTLSSLYDDTPAFGRIVNNRHFNRLSGLIDSSKVVYGNEKDEVDLLISPTIVDGITWKDSIMSEEIFGPILPILTYKNLDEVIQIIKSKEKPLALYLFTSSKEVEKEVFTRISFGGGAINDTLMHVSNPHLPFGGVGASGMGYYHGKSSFNIFSNQKTYIKKGTRWDPSIAYPPYHPAKVRFIKRILK